MKKIFYMFLVLVLCVPFISLYVNVYAVDTDEQTRKQIVNVGGITKNDVVVDTIAETWNLADKTELTRVYIMTVINADTSDEEVTSIVCPDGKQIMLEGFIVG